MKPIVAAAWQMEPTPGDIDANLDALRRALDRREARDVDLFVAPEMFATGWLQAKDPTPAQSRRVRDGIGDLAREHGAHVATSILTIRGGRRRNTFHLFAPNGDVLGTYDKIHLWAKESSELTPGRSPRAIEASFGTAAGLVCYDVEFPEVARRVAIAGAEVLIVPAAFYSSSSWDVMTRARALENGCFLVAANQFGGDPKHPHNGESRIVGPRGEVLVSAPLSGERIVTAKLAPTRIREARVWAPFLRDLRMGRVTNA